MGLLQVQEVLDFGEAEVPCGLSLRVGALWDMHGGLFLVSAARAFGVGPFVSYLHHASYCTEARAVFAEPSSRAWRMLFDGLFGGFPMYVVPLFEGYVVLLILRCPILSDAVSLDDFVRLGFAEVGELGSLKSDGHALVG